MKRNYSRFALAAIGATLIAGSANAELIYGMTAASSGSTAAGVNLVSFDSATPGTTTTIGAFSGMVAGQSLREIDYNPVNGQVYAISSVLASGTLTGRLYTVALGSGVLTSVGTGFSFASTTSVVSMDFDPATGDARVITTTGVNARVSGTTGALLGLDPNLAYVGGDPDTGTPATIGFAYTNTGIYAWDYGDDSIDLINGPTGQVSTFYQPTGFLTFNAGADMDYSFASGTLYATHDDPASGASTRLVQVSTITGVETIVGNYGVPFVTSIAVVPVPEPATLAVLGLGAIAAIRRRRKS